MKSNLLLSNKKYGLLLLLCFPFLALVRLSSYYKHTFYQNFIWLFFGFLGIILLTNDSASDAYRYSIWFEKYANLPSELKVNYFTKSLSLDYFRPVSFYLVSLFTTSAKGYFLCIALFYGFFYKGILKFIFDSFDQKVHYTGALALLSFLFIIPFLGFKFIRSPVALVVYIYLVLMYLKTNKLKFLILSVTTVLIHFTFVLPLIFLVVYPFVPKKTGLFLLLYVASVFFTFFDFSSIKGFILMYLPQDLDSKKAYLNEDYKENLVNAVKQVNWYIKYRIPILTYSSIVLVLYFLYRSTITELKNINVLNFGLLFGVIANIISVVPSGDRFISVSTPLIWIFIITNYIQYRNIVQKTKFINFLFTSTILFNLIIGLRYLFDDISIEFFLGNPIVALFTMTNIPLIDFIKSFFN